MRRAVCTAEILTAKQAQRVCYLEQGGLPVKVQDGRHAVIASGHPACIVLQHLELGDGGARSIGIPDWGRILDDGLDEGPIGDQLRLFMVSLSGTR